MTTTKRTEIFVQEKKGGEWVDDSPWGCRKDAIQFAKQFDRPMRVVKRKTVVVDHDYVIYGQKESPSK